MGLHRRRLRLRNNNIDDDDGDDDDDEYAHASEDDDDDDDDTMYYRGLESITPHTKVSKRLNRHDAMMLVLNEVDRQYDGEHGSIYDPEQIKSLYQQISVDCQLEAEGRAIEDRKEIEEEEVVVVAAADRKEEKWNNHDDVVMTKQRRSVMVAAAAVTTNTTARKQYSSIFMNESPESPTRRIVPAAA